MNATQAHAYAATVRANRVIPCQCAACQQAAQLPAVLRIIAAEAQRNMNRIRATLQTPEKRLTLALLQRSK